MRRSLSLLLIAAVTAGSMAAIQAGETARKANRSIAREMRADVVQTGIELPLCKRFLEPTASTGLTTQFLPGEISGTRSLKSAPTAKGTVSAVVDLVGQANYFPELVNSTFYHIPFTDNGEFTPICNPEGVFNYGGVFDEEANTFTGVVATVFNGYYYSGNMYEMDMETGNVTRWAEIPSSNVGMLAFSVDKDPVSGLNYGYFYNDNASGYVWGYVDYQSMTRTAIRQISASAEVCQALGVTPDGQYYGVTGSADLIKIDKTTGESTVIGQVGYPTDFAPGSCVNPKGNTLFVFAVSSDQTSSSLYEIDLTTAATTEIARFPAGQIYNLFVLPPAADPKAPAEPALEVTAPEGSMTAAYTITLPSTLMDGTATTETMGWSLTVNGEEKASGNDAAGKTVTGELTLTETGYADFVAVASNSTGNSPKAKVKIFIGKGVPAAPANVAAAWADGKMTVSWDPVTTSGDGGYVNAAEITYDVLEGPAIIASGVTATSYAYDLEAPQERTSYEFSVIAHYDGMMSDAGIAKKIWLGAFDTPFETSFNSTSVFEDLSYTVLDANNDGKTWSATDAGAKYIYSSDNDGDDWLFSPEIRLQAGKAYQFTCSVSSDGKFPERIEVKAGRGANAEVMTLAIVPVTDVNTPETDPMALSGLIIPDADGYYNIGLHAVSIKDNNRLMVFSLSVGEGMSADAPAAAGLELTPDQNGDLSLAGKILVPAKSLAGKDITGSVSLTLFRDGTQLSEYESAPGQEISFTDNLPAKGNYTYSVEARCGELAGQTTEATVFVGPHPAMAPTNAYAVEDAQTGKVTITWDAVTKDIKGTDLQPQYVTYQVYKVVGGELSEPLLAEPTANTQATVQGIDNADVQQFMQFAVRALNRGEESTDNCLTSLIALGKPYSMPVTYTCAEDLDTHIVGTSRSSTDINVGLYYAEVFGDGMTGQDDDTFFGMKFRKLRQTADIFTGKIDLTGAVHPEVTFYTYKIDETDINQTQMLVVCDGEETLLYNNNHEGKPVDTWSKVRVSLADYAGKVVQIKLRGIAQKKVWVYFDNATVKEVPACDLEATGIAAPAKVKAGDKFNVTVGIDNLGYEAASNFTVNLYRNGELADTRTVAELPFDSHTDVVFESSLSFFDADNTKATYSAEIICTGDANAADNATETITVKRIVTKLPAVTDLSGEIRQEGVALKWTPYTPAERNPQETTFDFEDAESWAHEYYDWTFLDLDQKAVGGFSSGSIPGIVTGSSRSSFFVMDNTHPEFTGWDAVSGSKFLAALYNADGSAMDDWAISPLLTGEEQKVSFYAKSYSADSPETFEVLYATDDTLDPTAFTLLDGREKIGEEWTRYEFTLPAGALRFAIRSTGVDSFLFLIDDVTFTPEPMKATLIGYDIYRNGVLLNESPVNGGEYLDTEADNNCHTYHAVSRYAEGDSELSNAATIDLSGISSTEMQGVSVEVIGSDIIVTGAGSNTVEIVTTDGKILHRATGDTRLTVRPAVYIVTIGHSAVKVAVK